MSDSFVHVAREGRVAMVTINGPEAYNASKRAPVRVGR